MRPESVEPPRPARADQAPQARPTPAPEVQPRRREEVPALAPASRAPDQRSGSERDDLGSLGAISADITAMISGEEAFRLWSRHHSGEAGVFTRELYSEEDRETFDEIRRKHEGRSRVPRTVDRYVGEFERLLESLPSGEPGDRMRHTYLASETGKVFLILAHASGRLG
jgi:hypothetical protein